MALQKMPPIVGHSLLWAAGIAIIIVGLIIHIRQRLETDKIISAQRLAIENIASEQRFATAIKSIPYELPGRWHGTVGNHEASLLITKSNSQLNGKLIYNGVEENLSISFRKGENDSVILVMQGIAYTYLKKSKGRFSLDTFNGTIKPGGLVEGNYCDTASRRGYWSFKKIETDKQVGTGTNPATFKSVWNKTESPATIPAPEPAPVPQFNVDNGTAKDVSSVTQQEEPTADRDKQFTLAEDTALDVKNGLMWTRDGDNMTKKRMNWIDADAYCRRLTLGGYSNWRLPTKKELEALKLLHSGKAAGYGDLRIVDLRNAPASWSSTADPSHPDSAWVVYFDVDDGGSQWKSRDQWFRCVRAGEFEGSGLPLTVAKVNGRTDPSVLDTKQASATDGTIREGPGNKMSVGITGGTASTTHTDHWKTVMECQAAEANPNYSPTLTKKHPLANNETVKKHPTGGCFEMDLPDRLGGRGFVRIEKGRDFVVDRTTGAVLRLAVSNNAVYSWKPFPTEGSITND